MLKVVYLALAALAAVMVARANLAGRMLPARTGGPTPRYLDHVGFTLVALADGFVIVAMLDAGAPAWLTAAVGVTVALGGHLALRMKQRQPGGRPKADTAAPRLFVAFLALLCTALTRGVEFAHVLDWAPKSRYDGSLYGRLQESLYIAAAFTIMVIALLRSRTEPMVRPDHRRGS